MKTPKELINEARIGDCHCFWHEHELVRIIEEYSSLQCRERDERIRELKLRIESDNEYIDRVNKSLYEQEKTNEGLKNKADLYEGLYNRNLEALEIGVKQISELQDKVERYEKELKTQHDDFLDAKLNGFANYCMNRRIKFTDSNQIASEVIKYMKELNEALSSNKQML